MHFYITGHTGFKGSWLSQLLHVQGHKVSGQSLSPRKKSLYEVASIREIVHYDNLIDIRDSAATLKALQQAEPDVVIHLAAQPLVRYSYFNPEETFSTNVDGTLNVLRAVSAVDTVQASLVITTDKVYRNDSHLIGYKESDPLGGDDPYSASKAMADLLTQSWTKSFSSPPTAIARAGNVIGGGDDNNDRLLPDLLRAFQNNETALIRNPDAVRPWQHVLDCLNGYQTLIEQLLQGDAVGAWNFGPLDRNAVSVSVVANAVAEVWGDNANWTSDTSYQLDEGDGLREASLLTLDSTKARTQLLWRDKLSLSECISWTVNWQKAVNKGEEPRRVCEKQLESYLMA